MILNVSFTIDDFALVVELSMLIVNLVVTYRIKSNY